MKGRMKMKKIAAHSAGHYSAAVITGNTMYISGQLAADPKTGATPDGIAAQTRSCLENIETILREVGLDRNSIVLCRAFMADHSYWSEFNEEYAAFFGDHKPARIAVPIKGFKPGTLIEIEAVAELAE